MWNAGVFCRTENVPGQRLASEVFDLLRVRKAATSRTTRGASSKTILSHALLQVGMIILRIHVSPDNAGVVCLVIMISRRLTSHDVRAHQERMRPSDIRSSVSVTVPFMRGVS